ncbi:transcription initiation factor TFIID subunit 12-like isoform X2 [Ctenocephalides felis]|uniref:transcription initiation factor TFIID subunit 12-like isoform X2 n=1 Tax=Ctenocephalides felis TaxID=7515 RepID=UPI000E6E2B1D|nr:transcription initiation factor TFIID subunit 12-like isoform X2 [Ctenocephalides felis]XP_026473898.1 transcription initiation factor TFIID subunit 12-like isoform X2 [Ctenocephalides felis]
MNSQSSTIPTPTTGVQNMHQQCVGPTTTSMMNSGVSGTGGTLPIGTHLSDKPPQAIHYILTKSRLQDLVREIDPTEQLDEDVEDLLLQLADDFVESTINAACLFTKHRHSKIVEVKDVQLHLERNWNMWIPGFGTDELKPYKRSTITESHKQRMNLIRRSLKKY